MTAMLIPLDDMPAIDRAEAATLAATENARFVALVQSLDDEDWSRPTDCTEWDVRAMVSHVLGAMESHVSLRVLIRQIRAGNEVAGDRPAVDGMTEVQVRERAHLEPAELVEQLVSIAPKAAAARFRFPAPVRKFRSKVEVDGVMEPWTLAYLNETILTRDTWMHRVDIARATGRPLELTPEHDGRIVADVVAEWARRHGQPFTLQLTGAAGATFTAGEGGEHITMDAVEFCRTLSGRDVGTGLLRQPVPF